MVIRSHVTFVRMTRRTLHIGGTRNSTLLVWVEDVVLRLYGYMAGVSAV